MGKVEDSGGAGSAVGPGGSPPQSASELPWNRPSGPGRDSVATIDGAPPPPAAPRAPPAPPSVAEAIADSPIGQAVQRALGTAQRGLRELAGAAAADPAPGLPRSRKALPGAAR